MKDQLKNKSHSQDLPEQKKRIPEIPRWIYGNQLLACAELEERELKVLLKEGILKGYKSDGGSYSPYFDFYSVKDVKFNLIDIFEFETQGRLYLGDSWDIQCWRKLYRKDKGEQDEERKAFFPCPPGTKWEDIHITLVADNMVRVRTPQDEQRLTYHALRMQDKRKGDKPRTMWTFLKQLCQDQGRTTRQSATYERALPKTASGLSKHMQTLFGIADPFFEHYKKEKAYRTKARLSDQTIVYTPK